MIARKHSLAAVAALSLAIASVPGCLSLRVAETPAQRFYAAVAEYSIVAEAAASYVESPAADAKVVDAIKQVDAVAYKAIQAGRTALSALELVQSLRDRELLNAAGALNFARSQIMRWLTPEVPQ